MTRTKAIIVILVFVVAGAAFADFRVFEISGQVASNQQSDTQALCAYREDLRNRVDSGYKFLATHPHGIPGIPLGTIQLSLQNEQHTLTALSPLKC